jgi:hypothetical protein
MPVAVIPRARGEVVCQTGKSIGKLVVCGEREVRDVPSDVGV